MPVFHVLSGLTMGFMPCRGDMHVAPVNDKCEKFKLYLCRNVVLQPPKPSKFGILSTNLPQKEEFLTRFLQNFEHLCASSVRALSVTDNHIIVIYLFHLRDLQSGWGH